LDGTREFINRNGEFTINIALMEKSDDGRCYPVFGLVHVPVDDTTYWGGSHIGAFRQQGDSAVRAIGSRRLDSTGRVIVLGSRSYMSDASRAFVGKLEIHYPQLELMCRGSSLKSCLVAEGQADIYPRLGPTSEWDTAASQAIVEGAGGLFVDNLGLRFSYNFKENLINSDFLVVGDPEGHWPTYWGSEKSP
jgi:3'(2'), 5'-bisphosphate nucleotidase